MLRTEYPVRDLSMVDVLNQGCSKGHALERWAGYRGIPRKEVMAIGDNYNDIEMLAFAGVPFIMGNAAEELRRDGWTVTLPNDQNGVAAAIEQVLGSRFVVSCTPAVHERQNESIARNSGCAWDCCFLPCPALGADLAILRNGFSIRHERRETVGSMTRLYLGADKGYVDIATRPDRTL